MAFGSYDESEQREPEYAGGEGDEGGEEAIALHEHDHEGTVSFESGASTDDLVEGLASIKEAAEEE